VARRQHHDERRRARHVRTASRDLTATAAMVKRNDTAELRLGQPRRLRKKQMRKHPAIPHSLLSQPTTFPPRSHVLHSYTSSTSSNFEAIFNAASAKYTRQTGKDLLSHPLASKIDSCISPSSSLQISKNKLRHLMTSGMAILN